MDANREVCYRRIEEYLKIIRLDAEMEDPSLINEIYSFFKDEISLEKFQSNLSNLPNNGRNIRNSLTYVLESERIKTRYKSIRIILLFIAVETLMADSEYCTFDKWLTSKNISGIKERDKLLENINLVDYKTFKSLIIELSKEYYKHYGVTNKVRDFFVKYLDVESKKRLIHSILFFDELKGKFVYKCFISSDKCLIDTSDNCFEISPECKLNNEESMDEILRNFISFLYNNYRNSFVHEGEMRAVNDENCISCLDYSKKQHIQIHLSYKDLKETVIGGIKDYYFKHCAFIQ